MLYIRDGETHDCLSPLIRLLMESLQKWQVLRQMWHFVNLVLLRQYSENEIFQLQCQSVQQYYYVKIRGRQSTEFSNWILIFRKTKKVM